MATKFFLAIVLIGFLVGLSEEYFIPRPYRRFDHYPRLIVNDNKVDYRPLPSEDAYRHLLPFRNDYRPHYFRERFHLKRAPQTFHHRMSFGEVINQIVRRFGLAITNKAYKASHRVGYLVLELNFDGSVSDIIGNPTTTPNANLTTNFDEMKKHLLKSRICIGMFKHPRSNTKDGIVYFIYVDSSVAPKGLLENAKMLAKSIKKALKPKIAGILYPFLFMKGLKPLTTPESVKKLTEQIVEATRSLKQI